MTLSYTFFKVKDDKGAEMADCARTAMATGERCWRCSGDFLGCANSAITMPMRKTDPRAGHHCGLGGRCDVRGDDFAAGDAGAALTIECRIYRRREQQ